MNDQSARDRPTTNQSGRESPEAIHLPRPTIWPAVLAAGITLTMAGIILALAFTVVGVLVSFIALFGWIAELRHE